MRHAGGGGKQLRVRGGHGGGENTGDDDAADERGEHPVRGQQSRGVDDEVFRLGLGAGHGDRAGLCHAEADYADNNGDGQGNDDPDGCHAAAERELFLALCRHEVQQHMGHTEVTKPPRERGEYFQRAVARRLAGDDVGARAEVEVAGDRLRVLHDGAPPAGNIDAEYEHDDERNRHDKALNKAGDGCRHESAGCAVRDDDSGGDDHRGHVVKAEKTVEKLAACGKAGRRVGDKEDDDGQRADGLDELGLVAEAAGEKVRHGDGIDLHGVSVQTLGNDQPVEICTEAKTDGGPSGLRHAAEERQTGDAHQQVCAHVRRLRAHRGHDGAELSAAEVEVLGRAVFGIHKSDDEHTNKVHDNGYKNTDRCGVEHNSFLSFSSHAVIIMISRRGARGKTAERT